MESCNSQNKNKKKQMSWLEIDNEDTSNSALNSKIFYPSEVTKTINEVKISEIIDIVKVNEFIFKLKNYILGSTELLLVEPKCDAMFEKIIQFDKENKEIFEKVINNPSLYSTSKTKTDFDLLKKVCLDIPIEKRTGETIKEEYNKIKPNNKICESTARKNISHKLYFKYRSTEIKSHNYFTKFRTVNELVFIYRILLDFNNGHKLIFFDEMGLCQIPNNKKSWVHVSEEPRTIENKQFKRINLLMISSLTNVEDYYISPRNTNWEEVFSFFSHYIKEIGSSITKEQILIMDNARFHRKEELLKLLESNFKRILFIPPYLAGYNQIEMSFKIIKTKIKKRNPFTM